MSSHDDYLLDEENGNVVSNSQKSAKEKISDIVDLNNTSDFEEELTDDSDYGKRKILFIYFSELLDLKSNVALAKQLLSRNPKNK